MKSLSVLSPGMLSTVQDLGRFGYAQFGVSASGAADAVALRLGNRLVGNREDAAAVEMTIAGGTFVFDAGAVAVVTGGEFWKPLRLAAGETLSAGPIGSGARAYLCVRGGIDAPRSLGSASVHVTTGLGGRPLRKGDVLPIGHAEAREPLWDGFPFRFAAGGPLRVTAGPQAHWFGEEFYQAEYEVTPESNRMGLRLRGPAVTQPSDRQLLTEGAPLGAVQIPPGGQPIVLFVEHQTTGGYPKIANVIAADLWRVGQLRPGARVRFERVTLETALALYEDQERVIAFAGAGTR